MVHPWASQEGTPLAHTSCPLHFAFTSGAWETSAYPGPTSPVSVCLLASCCAKKTNQNSSPSPRFWYRELTFPVYTDLSKRFISFPRTEHTFQVHMQIFCRVALSPWLRLSNSSTHWLGCLVWFIIFQAVKLLRKELLWYLHLIQCCATTSA